MSGPSRDLNQARSPSARLPEDQAGSHAAGAADGTPSPPSATAARCPSPQEALAAGALASDWCGDSQNTDGLHGPPVQQRQQFETLLTELSATFVNVEASQVDAQIETALQRIVEFLGVDRGGLAEVLVDQKELVITHSYHRRDVPPLPRTIVKDQLPWYAETILRGELLRLSRLPDDLPATATLERQYCIEVGLKSHVMIPLKATGSIVGAIGFGAFRQYREWPERLIRRLRLVGEVFTNALARKQADQVLRAREKDLGRAQKRLRQLAARLLHAQEEERRRIAREMHDDWTQRLAVLGIDMAKLEKQLGSPEKALPLLRTMQDQLVKLSEDVHALSRQLHPSILDDLGLVEALRSECASFSGREGIAVNYQPEGVPAGVPREIALCIYRVAQEALRNSAKHAAVSEARVSLIGTGTQLLLRVEDQGSGFDPGAVHSQPGLGLSSMEERVRLIRGDLAITSAPGRGTTVAVHVPLARSES